MEERGEVKIRDRGIDCFKGILVIQMIFAHSLQFFGDLGRSPLLFNISEFINLTTFSGFIFAFGYSGYGAYILKPYKTAILKILKNIIRLQIAFYISSFAYSIFIEGLPFRVDKIMELILIKRLAGWSEFLIAFSAVLLLLAVLHPLLKKDDIKVYIILSLVAMVITLLPYREMAPIMGIFLGGYGFAYFPAVPYFLYFIIGVFFSRHQIKINKIAVILSALGTVIFILSYVLNNYSLPSRFPLSLAWLIGATGFLYIYYLASIIFCRLSILDWLGTIGENSLFYLLISNILIFAVKGSRFYVLGTGYLSISFVVIMAVIGYLRRLIVKLK
ncbi:MAG: hypothetical protein ACI33K_01660 [Clostridiaceae bacterium]